MKYFNTTRSRTALCGLLLTTTLAPVFAADNPFLGGWELTIPGGGAGWLGVTKENGYYDAGLLWGGGSVMPVASVFFDNDMLYVTRVNEVKRKVAAGNPPRTHQFTELLLGRLDGDEIQFTLLRPRADGEGIDRDTFTGRRSPPMPPAPNLSQVKFGEPIALFNGKDLTGWRLTEPRAVSGWSVKDGLLVNAPTQAQGQPHKNYGNLRTDREFEDFNLKLETRIEKGENSGVYLRGIYEVQVCDSYGRPLDPHNLGAVYSRIKPTEAAEKPPGEWQTLDITLVDRHVTVILNGKKIIDNQPVLGCTGGALWSDVRKPGPIYLQGDHTGITYRNLVLKPVVK